MKDPKYAWRPERLSFGARIGLRIDRIWKKLENRPLRWHARFWPLTAVMIVLIVVLGRMLGIRV